MLRPMVWAGERRSGWSAWLVTLLAWVAAWNAWAQPVPGEFLVKYRSGGALQPLGVSALPAGTTVTRSLRGGAWHVVRMEGAGSAEDGVRRLKEHPGIEHAEPNAWYRLLSDAGTSPAILPNDPEFVRAQGLASIHAEEAWRVTTGTNGVVVAVLDTGIDASHPDLVSNLWRNLEEIPGNGLDDDGNGWRDDVIGLDVVEGDGDPSDTLGHGTHVAGIIGAAGNNGLGMSGVCWKVSLLPIRVGTADGFASTAQLVTAFDYVRSLRADGKNVRVINCSWGGEFPSVAMRDAIEEAGKAGILVVCAAGNDGQDNDLMPLFPAGYDVPQIVSVAASTDCGGLASFSNFGLETVDLAAPGEWVFSTFRGGDRYAVLSGTSMAAPYVSGVAALVLSRDPNLDVNQLKQVLLGSVDPVPDLQGRLSSGGHLNAARAVALATTASVPPLPEHPKAILDLEAISRNAQTGTLGNATSSLPSLDGTGRYVVFHSEASNLTPGDDGRFWDIFLYDRERRTMVRVSQNASGTGGNGDSWDPVISRDGRWIAFVSEAGNLVAEDKSAGSDVYLYDRELQTLELVSARPDGRGPGNGASSSPFLGPDGSWVAFDSQASDLVSGDSNYARDVFFRDRVRGVTERVSLSVTGAQGNQGSARPSVSDDGLLVAFESLASNLVARDRNNTRDIFVRNRKSGSTERLTFLADGTTEFRMSSDRATISRDGRYVAFETMEDDPTLGVVAGVEQDQWNSVVLVDRKSKTIRWIERPPGFTESQGHGTVETLSDDGRFVYFSSTDERWGHGAVPGDARLYELDQWSGTTVAVVVNRFGYAPEFETAEGRVSADGRFLAFSSGASNLVPGDGNSVGDVFLIDRGTLRADLSLRRVGEGNAAWVGGEVRHAQAPQRVVTRLGENESATFQIRLANAGPPGAFVIRLEGPLAGGPVTWKASHERSGQDISASLATEGWTSGLLAGGSNDLIRVELRQPASGPLPSRDSVRLVVSPVGETRELDAVFLAVDAPPTAPSVVPVSCGASWGAASHHARAAMATRDGARVVFLSEADNLVPGADANYAADVFLWDRASGGVRRLSDASATVQANGASGRPWISDDGRWVAFPSRASNLVPGDTNRVQDIFLRDLERGGITRLTETVGGVQANSSSDSVVLSGTAKVAAFASHASNLVPGDENRSRDIFVRHLETGVLECVSRSATGEWADADSESPSLSRDGRFVLFQSKASNLGIRDRNGTSDIYLWDRVGRKMELISMTPSRTSGNGPSLLAAMSDDARWITFHSYATDLLPGAKASEASAYLLDRETGVLRRVETLVRGLPDGVTLSRAVVSRDGLRLGLTVTPPCSPGVGASQVYVCDVSGTGLRLVSRTSAGGLGDDASSLARWSASSRYLTLETQAENLVGEPTRGAGQVLLADLMSAGVNALVQRESGAPWRGDETLTGGDRSMLVTVGQGAGRPLVLSVRNAGTGPDRFRIRAVATDPARLTVTGLPSAAVGPVAVSLTGGSGWLSPELETGAELRLEVQLRFVTVGSPLDRVQVLLQVTSDADRTQVDEFWVLAVPDLNFNRIPDAWEAAHPLVQALGNSDFDRDGLEDYEEWLVGSNPSDPFDVSLRLSARRSLGDGLEVAWRGQQYRWYWVERSPFPGGAFAPAHATPLVGSDGPMTWRESAGRTSEGGIYRVRVELP